MANEVQLIKIDSIDTSPTNPRKNFDGEAMEELTNSISLKGLITPIIVRTNGRGKRIYELVAGERRVRASKAAGLQEIPAYIVSISDEEVRQRQLIEFEQSADISPLEKAEAFAHLLENLSLEEVAANIGKGPGYVAKMVKLLDLIGPAKNALKAGKLPLAHAQLICRQQPKDQVRAFEFALKSWQEFEDSKEYRNELNPTTDDEEMAVDDRGQAPTVCSLEDLKDFIRLRLHLDLRAAAFDKADPNLVPAAGACTDCPFRTGYAKDLFDDVTLGDICTNAECFHKKQDVNLGLVKAQLKKEKTRYIEITKDERKPEGHAGALTERSFKYVKRGSCKHVRIGVYIDGANKGHTRTICCEKKKCRTHFGDTIRERQRRGQAVEADTTEKITPEEVEKRRLEVVQQTIEKEVRDQLAEKVLRPEILKNIPREFTKARLVHLLDVLTDEVFYSQARDAQKFFRLKGKPDAWSEKDLIRMILGSLALCDLDNLYEDDDLEKLAKNNGIDIVKLSIPIREQVRKLHAKELRPKVAGVLVKGMCQICGCREDRACIVREEGAKMSRPCAWVDDTKTLCDNPKCIEAVEKQEEKAKKQVKSPLDVPCKMCGAKIGKKCTPVSGIQMIRGGHAGRELDAMVKPSKAAKRVGTMGVVCPVCKAGVGQNCVPVKGKKMDMMGPKGKGSIHDARLIAAIEASNQSQGPKPGRRARARAKKASKK